jgi:hypothetical protein
MFNIDLYNSLESESEKAAHVLKQKITAEIGIVELTPVLVAVTYTEDGTPVQVYIGDSEMNESEVIENAKEVYRKML